MRIIAGKYGGRKLEVPQNNAIRPTSDKVRGAIFNVLGSRMDFDGAIVLDLFSGTGALGLEALSRGANFCHFVDKSRSSLFLTKRNAQILGIEEQSAFLCQDATILKKSISENRPAHLFFCDPPYNKALIEPTLKVLCDGQWLSEGAIGVLEAEKGWTATLSENFEIFSQKEYGDTSIVYIRYK